MLHWYQTHTYYAQPYRLAVVIQVEDVHHYYNLSRVIEEQLNQKDNDEICMAPLTQVIQATGPCIVKFCSDAAFTTNSYSQPFSYKCYTNGIKA